MKKLNSTLILILFVNLLYAQNPRLWGMTALGGTDSVGTIIKINGDGTGFGVAHSFDSLTGYNPSGNLLQASNGKLYGMAQWGGINNNGVIFSFDTSNNSYTDLFDFNFTDGAYPLGSLIQLNNGMMYGMTNGGGYDSVGVLFSFDPSNNAYTKLLDFDSITGRLPIGDLMLASNGKLYGMTSNGGSYYGGTIFSFDTFNNLFTKLLDFNVALGATGVVPYGNLIELGNGKLYGMTSLGGTNFSYGVLFSFDINTNTYMSLFNFSFFTGQIPLGDLVLANNGLLYGMTFDGGAHHKGTIFSFDTSIDSLTNLFDFDFQTGCSPMGSLKLASDGKLYGFGAMCGNNLDGVIFSFDPSNNSYTKLFDLNHSTGFFPNGDLIELTTTTGINSNLNPYIQPSVLPNPFTSEITIDIQEKSLRQTTITIKNILGQTVFNNQENNLTNAYTKSFDLSELANGIYLLDVTIDGERSVQKIIKQ